jgi:hypothetical protein
MRFLAHIESLHYHKAPFLRAAMENDGGYPLHIDATTEDGKGTMLVLYSGWRRWVLGAWKIPTECAEQIEPHITESAKIFGEPCAIMRDLGKPMRKAAEEAGKKMANPPHQRACHFHFLSDVGSGLLQESYGILRAHAREHNVRKNIRIIISDLKRSIRVEDMATFQRSFNALSAQASCVQIADIAQGNILAFSLAKWILEYRQEDGNLKFPFGRPYVSLYRRCQTANGILDVFL